MLSPWLHEEKEAISPTSLLILLTLPLPFADSGVGYGREEKHLQMVLGCEGLSWSPEEAKPSG